LEFKAFFSVDIAKKIPLALLVVVLLLLLFIEGAPRPSPVSGSITITDHNGYPCFRISFRTVSYPITFLLMEEGRLLDTNVANKPGDVVYLHLTPGKPLSGS
jgi:hypothetical protein